VSQLRQGTVALTNGNALVRGNYDVIFSTNSGTFAGGEAITWPGGGTGNVVSFLSVSHRLVFYRTAGPVPVAATVISAAGSGASGTIGSLSSTSVPRFDLELPGGGPPVFEVPGIGEVYVVTSETADTFTLTAPYAGVTDPQSGYILTRDFTANRNYPMPKSGDVEFAGAIGRALSLIDVDVAGPAKSALALTSPYVAPAGADGTAAEIRKLANGEVSLYGAVKRGSGTTFPSTIATLPVGYRSTGRRRWLALCATSSSAVVELVPLTGVLQLLSGDATTVLHLDVIHFVGEV
jgi:hypothetical protein